jgi:AraC family transcriptional regulator of adaptative response / DNA-3-methyladenine glycosylase II
MRLGERDAFPAADPALRQALHALDPSDAAEVSAAEVSAAAEAWRPWRALAATYLVSHRPPPRRQVGHRC